ncbi:NUDIX domain-containing protein [Priestia taiwanensis]|uniref:DNA mismatch repair protein MutT n=1 Tax=Priestia taiwanensis TaxID=1347902 RepID=A0A917ARP5_9BACI|nr:NUDIX domain-containing protein [Priestia taiwanensis]MBM7363233.1 8-oxo-dGTP diphosphatase [Priestia taiwanensis]GGE68761.1 DNA mismatch repair protein MutT [Priestia taiwanensis]
MYTKRKGVYAVIFHATNDKVAVVQTERGHCFLPGGGLNGDETEVDCLRREVREETGYEVSVHCFIGKATHHFYSMTNEPIENEGTFYIAQLLYQTGEQVDVDHLLIWLREDQAERLLVHEHHRWAVREGYRRRRI